MINREAVAKETLYLDIHVRRKVNVNQRIQKTMNIHQLLPATRSLLLRCVKEMSDESSLCILPLNLGDHVSTIEHHDIGQPGHQHHPLLLPGELIKERTALDPQVIQPRKLPQLLHLIPAIDLCDGNIQALQGCWNVVNIIQGRK